MASQGVYSAYSPPSTTTTFGEYSQYGRMNQYGDEEDWSQFPVGCYSVGFANLSSIFGPFSRSDDEDDSHVRGRKEGEKRKMETIK